jgi:hypothetical protein
LQGAGRVDQATEVTIAYSLIALLVAAGIVATAIGVRRIRAKRKAERHLGRRGRNTIDVRRSQ